MARLLLALDRFPPLRRSVLRMLTFEPAIFAKLLTWDAPMTVRPAGAQKNL